MALTQHTFGQGWVTYSQVFPPGIASTALKIGNLTTDCVVKRRYPNGDICQAILTANIPTAGVYGITQVAAPGGSLTPVWPASGYSVAFNISGTVYTATLPSTYSSSYFQWLSGAQCNETVVLVRPTTSGGTPHPCLDVIFIVRSYSDGGFLVSYVLNNVRDVQAMNQFTYALTVTQAGSTIKSGTYTQYIFTRGIVRGAAVGTTVSHITTYDLTPYKQAGILPNSVTTARSNSSWDLTSGNPSAFTPTDTCLQSADLFRFGLFPPGQSGVGYHPDLPSWSSPGQEWSRWQDDYMWDGLMKQADLYGSWGFHFKRPDGVTDIQDTTDVFNGTDGFGGGTQGCFYKITLGGSNNFPNGPAVPFSAPGNQARGQQVDGALPDNAHINQHTFLPYMLTGDYYYLEEVKYCANWCIMQCDPGDQITEPTLEPTFNHSRRAVGASTGGRVWAMTDITREFGHCFQNLIQCAAAVPDADSTQTYFRLCVQNTLDGVGDYVTNINPSGGITQVIFWEHIGTGDGTGRILSPWRQNYIIAAFRMAAGFGLWPAGAWLTACERMIHSLITCMQYGIANGYAVTKIDPWYIVIGRIVSNQLVYYTDAATMFRENDRNTSTVFFDGPGTNPGLGLFNGGTDIVGAQGVEAWTPLEAGIQLGITGAQTCRDWLIGVTGMQNDLNNKPGYGVTWTGITMGSQYVTQSEGTPPATGNITKDNISSRVAPSTF